MKTFKGRGNHVCEKLLKNEGSEIMGAWGIGNFENDCALDWVSTVLHTKGKGEIDKALKAIDKTNDYIEEPECSEALCAIEIVVAKSTGDFSNLSDELKEWLTRKNGFFKKAIEFNASEIELAKRVLSKIVNNSELQELWEESPDYEEWRSLQSKLDSKLK